MANAEKLFQSSRIVSEQSFQQETATGIPLIWRDHTYIQTLIDEQVKDLARETDSPLAYRDVPDAVRQIICSGDGLTETVRELFPAREVRINAVHAMTIQMGAKAYIILCRAATSCGDSDFVLYVSRNPHSGEANETVVDYLNLKQLSAQAQSNLKPNARKQFQILNPYALMEDAEIGGKLYAAFSMPFIAGFGELRFDLYEDPVYTLRFPYCRYSVTFSDRLKNWNEQSEIRNQNIRNGFERLLRRYPKASPEYIYQQTINLPEYQQILSQMEDTLVGNALIYVLSEGMFPRDFMFNSGDWMVNFHRNRLDLYLVTIRGGWEKIESDDHFIERMVNQLEIVPGRELTGQMMPVFYKKEKLIRRALKKAYNQTIRRSAE